MKPMGEEPPVHFLQDLVVVGKGQGQPDRFSPFSFSAMRAKSDGHGKELVGLILQLFNAGRDHIRPLSGIARATSFWRPTEFSQFLIFIGRTVYL